jgi:hypothetical protein
MDVLSADPRVLRTPVSLLRSRLGAGNVRGNGDESSLVIKGGVEPPHSITNIEQVHHSDQQINRGDSAIGDE